MDQETVALIADTPAAELGDVPGYLATVLPEVDAPLFTDGLAAEAPQALRDGLRHVVSRLQTAWEGRRRHELTLNRYTAEGFQPAPAPRPRHRLSTGDRLRRQPEAAVLWCRLTETTALCSANGYTAHTTTSPAAVATLLDLLDRGPATVGELREAVAADQRDDVGDLLDELWAFRAVELDE